MDDVMVKPEALLIDGAFRHNIPLRDLLYLLAGVPSCDGLMSRSGANQAFQVYYNLHKPASGSRPLAAQQVLRYPLRRALRVMIETLEPPHEWTAPELMQYLEDELIALGGKLCWPSGLPAWELGEHSPPWVLAKKESGEYTFWFEGRESQIQRMDKATLHRNVASQAIQWFKSHKGELIDARFQLHSMIRDCDKR